MEYTVYVTPSKCQHCCCTLKGGYYYLCFDIHLNIFANVNTGNVLCISKTISKKLAPIILPKLILLWKPITKLNLYTESGSYEYKSIITGGNRKFSYYHFSDPQDPDTYMLNSGNVSFYLSTMKKTYDPIEKIKMLKRRIDVLEYIYGCDLGNVVMETKKELCDVVYRNKFEYSVLCAMSLGIKMDAGIFNANRDARDFISNVYKDLCNSICKALKHDIF
jgi:hypothetical protein